MIALDRLRLGDLVRAGWRGVSRYTGLTLAVFVVQFLIAWVVGLAVLQVLASAFADRPMFDDAIDGDLVSLLQIVNSAGAVVSAIKWMTFGAVALWVVMSWFLAGGVLAVLTERPVGRRETARCFGAGGAATFLAFGRLAIVSGLLQIPAVFAFLMGGAHLASKIGNAITVGELIGPIAIAVVPAALLHIVASTIIDYARAELTLRRPTHESLGVVRATIRAAGYMVRRPVAMLHVGCYWLAFLAVSFAFVWLAHGHAMLGTSGALAVFAIRQCVTLGRTALKVGLLAGQVELTATRPPPPRTISTVEVAR